MKHEEGDKVNTDSKFVYRGCACQGGYTGRFCDSDIDACEMNGQPCYAGVKCIDLPPPANASGYTCGPCPSGYTGNGAQCVGGLCNIQSDTPTFSENKYHQLFGLMPTKVLSKLHYFLPFYNSCRKVSYKLLTGTQHRKKKYI